MENPTKVLLVFGGQRRIVTVPQTESFCDIFLINKAKELCASPFVLQFFDKEFDEWCNIDDNYQPTHKEKLQIVQIENNSSVVNRSSDFGGSGSASSGESSGFASESGEVYIYEFILRWSKLYYII